MPSKVWDKITYPFPNFNGAWINDFIPHFIVNQGSHGSPAMKFSDLFLTFPWLSPNFYWLFAAWKYDILTFAGIHMGHTDAKKKKVAATIWQKNMYDLSFYVLYQLNHDNL